MNYKNLLWLVAPIVLFTACKNKSASNNDLPERTTFFEKAGMDVSVSPGENFFLYASGNWMKKTKIPASEVGWGSFYTLYDDNQKILQEILNYVSSENSGD